MPVIQVSGKNYRVVEWHKDARGNTTGARVTPADNQAPGPNLPDGLAGGGFGAAAEVVSTRPGGGWPLPDGVTGKDSATLDVVIVDPKDAKGDNRPDGVTGGGFGANMDVVFVGRRGRRRGGNLPDGVTGGGFGSGLDIVDDPDGFGGDGLGSAAALGIKDGRYDGANHRLALDLRVDFDTCGAISGDLFGTSFGGRDPLVSFKTATPRISRSDPQPWPAMFEREGHAPRTGLISLEGSASANTVICRLRVDGAIPGLPNGVWFDLAAEWQSQFMRRIGIEMEREVDTDGPPSYNFNGRNITYQSVLGDAGFDVFETGSPDLLPAPPGGKWGQTQVLTSMLDAAAHRAADVSLEQPAWQNQLLWLNEPSRPGLFGIMFDTSVQLPRQGSAVFEGEIKRLRPLDAARRAIRTAAHEVGHSLNLVHRFEREVGRADSLSIMNYDQRYRGGGRAHEYWRDFAFEFDKDELEFLRHGPRHQVIPGGRAFHSVNYWADGNGGYLPYRPEAPLTGWGLRLDGPTDTYMFGQPVFLRVTLTNLTGRTARVDRNVLDPKGDFLSVLVRRVSSSPFSGRADTTHFHPIVERCYDADGAVFKTLPPGRSMSDNIQISYGAGGFTFAEPGVYDIRVVGSVPDDRGTRDPRDDLELITVSNPWRIRVEFPHSSAEEEEGASTLLRPDVGAYIALGGAYRFEAADHDLRKVVKRRMGKRKKVSDPVAAAIIRCQGIDIGRPYIRLTDNKLQPREGDPLEAIRLLSQIANSDSSAFDEATCKSTVKLIKSHEKRAKDLKLLPKEGGTS